MDCLNCGNCKSESSTYYCLMKNDFVVKESNVTIVEKSRRGWKKGDPDYELHRRKSRKEVEV